MVAVATTGSDDAEEYVEAVLRAVEAVPAGRATTYGDVAVHVGERLGRGGPRQVGAVMAGHGSAVCWWRVVRADGRPVRGHEAEALRLLAAEGTPTRSGRVRLDLVRWRWERRRRSSGAGEPAEITAGTTI